jgi:ribonuclease HII
MVAQPPLSSDYENTICPWPHTAGVDEVGRGALAGPVVAAAVLVDVDSCRALAQLGVRDSKRLSATRREALVAPIRAAVLGVAIAEATVAEITQLNIRRATLTAMHRAIAALDTPPLGCLIDGRDALPDLGCPQMTLVGGDDRSLAIGAASIIAKVYRDRLMARWANQYPAYGFDRHRGYGTHQHRQALQDYGPTPLHRPLFLRKILATPRQLVLGESPQ